MLVVCRLLLVACCLLVAACLLFACCSLVACCFLRSACCLVLVWARPGALHIPPITPYTPPNSHPPSTINLGPRAHAYVYVYDRRIAIQSLAQTLLKEPCSRTWLKEHAAQEDGSRNPDQRPWAQNMPQEHRFRNSSKLESSSKHMILELCVGAGSA